MQELKLRENCCPFFVSDEYQIETADFYLISSEGYGLYTPVACFKRKRLYGSHPDGYLLCDIDPSISIKDNYSSILNTAQVILASRHKNYSLFPINEWPAYVHIAVSLKENINDLFNIAESDVKLVAWGELLRNEEEAVKKIYCLKTHGCQYGLIHKRNSMLCSISFR